jgi:hypothetical protein
MASQPCEARQSGAPKELKSSRMSMGVVFDDRGVADAHVAGSGAGGCQIARRLGVLFRLGLDRSNRNRSRKNEEQRSKGTSQSHLFRVTHRYDRFGTFSSTIVRRAGRVDDQAARVEFVDARRARGGTSFSFGADGPT